MKQFDVVPFTGMAPEFGLLGAMLQDGTREWRDELEGADEDTIVWQIQPGGYSIGALILEMAAVEVFWIEQVIAGRTSDLPELVALGEKLNPKDGFWLAPPRESLEWYYAMQDRIRTQTLETLTEFADTTAFRVVRDQWEMTLRWIVQHVFHHEAYHGGQAVLLKVVRERLRAEGPHHLDS